MLGKLLMRCSQGLSRPLSILSSSSLPPPWTKTKTQTTLPQSNSLSGGFLTIPSNFVIKDHRHNIYNHIFNNKHKTLLPLASSPVVPYSSDVKSRKGGDEMKNAQSSKDVENDLKGEDIKDKVSRDTDDIKAKEKDVSKLKEDWEEEGVVCEYCDIGFASEEALQTHLDMTGKGNGGGCRGLWLIRNKADVNAGKLKHVCDIGDCRIGFKTKSKLEKHKAVHSEERPFVCSECGNSYKLQGDLNQHVREKHSGQVFECPECDKTFSQESNMKTHLKICRQEEKDFKCSQCGVKFHTNGHLTSHIKQVHNNERPHKCELCDERFSRKGHLKQHMRSVHENAKPHQCEDCSVAFSTVGELKNHRIRHHTFDWPHICHVCEERGIVKGFIAPGGLEKHMKAKHPAEYQEQLEREKPAVCHVCEKRFRNESEVNIHIKKKHN